jgi:nicotinamide riboside kinase
LAKVLRVCLTGAECTGKTTLARQLAEHFGATWVPEFAREYALRVARPLTVDDVEPIARGQRAAEDAATGDLIVLDTDLVSTKVYSNYYYSVDVEPRAADLYLLLDTDLPFKLDAARDDESHRAAHHALFVKTLEGLGANVVLISGENRLQQAIDAIERYAAR